MALFKSTVLAQISGSVNGITFAHGPGGAYARNRSLPSNPGTDRQDQVRTAMAAISQAYRSVLTEPQRNAWTAYGQSLAVINRLGDTIKLSGIAAFNRVNLFRMSTLELGMVLNPPPAPSNTNPPPTYIGATVFLDEVDPPRINYDLAGQSATGYSAVTYYSGILSPGIRYYRGPYLARTGSTITTSPLFAPMAALPPGLEILGQKIAAKLTVYDTTTTLPIWTVHVDPMIASS